MFFPFKARWHTLCAMQHCQIYLQCLDSGITISFLFSCQHLRLLQELLNHRLHLVVLSKMAFILPRCFTIALVYQLSKSVPLVFHQASSLTHHHHMWRSFSSLVFSVCARLYFFVILSKSLFARLCLSFSASHCRA
jgi:hypothetical protein